jgi:hypothetical protein
LIGFRAGIKYSRGLIIVGIGCAHDPRILIKENRSASVFGTDFGFYSRLLFCRCTQVGGKNR